MIDSASPEGRTNCSLCDTNLRGPGAGPNRATPLYSQLSDGNLLCTECLRMICDEILFDAGHTPADKEVVLSMNIGLIYPGAFDLK